MKNILSILTIFILVIAGTSCGNKKNKTENKPGYHTHEDGTVHRDDAHSHDAPAQESFEVKPDIDAGHKHDGSDHDNEEHEHGDVDGEDHN